MLLNSNSVTSNSHLQTIWKVKHASELFLKQILLEHYLTKNPLQIISLKVYAFLKIREILEWTIIPIKQEIFVGVLITLNTQ